MRYLNVFTVSIIILILKLAISQTKSIQLIIHQYAVTRTGWIWGCCGRLLLNTYKHKHMFDVNFGETRNGGMRI